MSDLFDEIVKLRQREIESVPIVIVGNKHELPNPKAQNSFCYGYSTHVQITDATVEAWMSSRAGVDGANALMCFVPVSVENNRGGLS